MIEVGPFEAAYQAAGYTRRYGAEIDRLKRWFAERLPGPPPLITDAHRSVGLDALPWTRKLRDEAHSTWLEEHEYDPSYNQLCVAFFAAYDEAAS